MTTFNTCINKNKQQACEPTALAAGFGTASIGGPHPRLAPSAHIFRRLPTWCALCFGILLCFSVASAADVRLQISGREAYVGAPLILQLQIRNAESYDAPKIPSVDGLTIRSAGTPSKSSQITIINGRRSSQESVNLRYLITPKQPGSFEIPSLNLTVDGKQVQTEPITITATKSENDGLVLVEIEGKQDQVYVGQPLELTLKLWVRPFSDKASRITLSEGDTWSLISDSASWGVFKDRMQELRENRQRPEGREVARRDADGNPATYYLYEVEATVYPKRPSQIDGSDVQVIVNYPTALGRSRGLMDSFFGNDDLFGFPFERRLRVTGSRPVVADANVDATEVLPVPTEGRPDDYQGAVGNYRIETQARPTSVSAGDEITLQIGIVGTGPMELVQAPPLSRLDSFRKDFKLDQQPLAGIVRDDTKFFSTTIRPRREGITEIPPVPFSFFNPDTKEYETVTSQPIEIEVDATEMLKADSIVGASTGTKTPNQNENASVSNSGEPTRTVADTSSLLANASGPGVLRSVAPRKSFPWWCLVGATAPLVWLLSFAWIHHGKAISALKRLQSAKSRAVRAVESSTSTQTIADALTEYVSASLGGSSSLSNEDFEAGDVVERAAGQIRMAGQYPLAAQFESLVNELSNSALPDASPTASQRQAALNLIWQLEEARVSRRRVPKRDRPESAARSRVSSGGTTASIIGWAVACLLGSQPSYALATETTLRADRPIASEPTVRSIGNANAEQMAILREATTVYEQADRLENSEPVDAKELYAKSARHYQTLVDAGIHNAEVFTNLGNALFRSDQLSRAIANYRRSLQYAPLNHDSWQRLQLAQHALSKKETDSTTPENDRGPTDFDSGQPLLNQTEERLSAINHVLVSWVGQRSITGLFAVCSCLFWGTMTLRTFGKKIPAWRIAVAPLFILVLTAASMLTSIREASATDIAVVIEPKLELRNGDGENFDVITSLESCAGRSVKVLGKRGDWTRVQTPHGQVGWTQSIALEPIAIEDVPTTQ